VENLSIESYVATLNMEQSGALSATQAKTCSGDTANGGEPALIARARIRATRLGCVGRGRGPVIEENPDEWSRYSAGDEKRPSSYRTGDETHQGSGER